MLVVGDVVCIFLLAAQPDIPLGLRMWPERVVCLNQSQLGLEGAKPEVATSGNESAFILQSVQDGMGAQAPPSASYIHVHDGFTHQTYPCNTVSLVLQEAYMKRTIALFTIRYNRRFSIFTLNGSTCGGYTCYAYTSPQTGASVGLWRHDGEAGNRDAPRSAERAPIAAAGEAK